MLRIMAGVRWQQFLVLYSFGSTVISGAPEYILHNRVTAVPGNAASSTIFKNFLSDLRLAIWSYCVSFRGTHCQPFLLLPGTKRLCKWSRALPACQGQLSRMCALRQSRPLVTQSIRNSEGHSVFFSLSIEQTCMAFALCINKGMMKHEENRE